MLLYLFVFEHDVIIFDRYWFTGSLVGRSPRKSRHSVVNSQFHIEVFFITKHGEVSSSNSSSLNNYNRKAFLIYNVYNWESQIEMLDRKGEGLAMRQCGILF